MTLKRRKRIINIIKAIKHRKSIINDVNASYHFRRFHSRGAVDDGVRRRGNRQHECVRAAQRDWQHQVNGVDS
jgi:hypothetical protein